MNLAEKIQSDLVDAMRAKDELRTHYPNLTPSNCLGDYGGKLSHNGEHLALIMPDTCRSRLGQHRNRPHMTGQLT